MNEMNTEILGIALQIFLMVGSYKVEAKGKDRNEISFFAKFVLCSNNESLPVIIDEGESTLRKSTL